MGRSVLNSILSFIHESTCVSIMVDETTDISNKEQLTLVMRRIDHNLDVYEEFLGMYQIDSATVESITSTILDALMHFQIPLTKLRGQCYDGCSTMAGSHNGVANKVQDMEPKAVFTHCYGHALNLAVGDTIKKCVMLRDCLDTCYELVKLIKWSPKRDTMLKRLKEESCDDAPSIRTLCLTRWTVRAESMKSIVANYTNILSLWEEALECTSETEMKARIQGFSSQMDTFKFYFSLILAEMILRHTDNLSKSLQNPELASTQAYEIAMLTVKTLQSIHIEANFDLFWE
ncbi:zinc finger MYM-type protein 1-like [Dysidea avara]|uniref:zinc finger MYM-type protein 1-like n=1 Tax=Dysidea avara TaxID=196820 RepID=UPI00331AEFCE